MPDVHGSLAVPGPPTAVWDLIHGMEGWVCLLEGYAGHTRGDDGALVLELLGDVGFMTKRTRLRVDILETRPPWVLRAQLRGLSDPLHGRCEVELVPAPSGQTTLHYTLSLEAGGLAAPVWNRFLGQALPRAVGNLGQRLAALAADSAGGQPIEGKEHA